MANPHPNMSGLRPQKPGQPSLNPKGRPISAKVIAEKIGTTITPDIIRKRLKELNIPTKEKKVKEVMMYILAMHGMGMYPDANVNAIKEYLDRSDGKAEQPIKLDANIRTTDVDFDEMKKSFYANLKK